MQKGGMPPENNANSSFLVGTPADYLLIFGLTD